MSGSRAKRRLQRGSARSRRTPVRPAGSGRGLRIPWVPLAVLIGVAAVVGLIAYLLWQQSRPAGQDAAQRAEADQSTDLPGVWEDLATLYGGPYGDDASHVRRDVDYSDQTDTPSVGGPHWGSSGCAATAEESPLFCGPAPWGIFREPWDEETLVHNMEHGGVVLWYNTGDQAIITELEELFEDRLKGDEILLVMAPYPQLEDETIAITSWSRRDKFPVSEYTKERVEDFIDAHLCRFNPEDLPGCGD